MDSALGPMDIRHAIARLGTSSGAILAVSSGETSPDMSQPEGIWWLNHHESLLIACFFEFFLTLRTA
jgi:hypothetical protein